MNPYWKHIYSDIESIGGGCWKFSSDKAEAINTFLKDVSTKAISPEKISDNIEEYIDIYKSMIELHKKVETVGQNEDDIDVILDKNEEDGFVTYMNFKPGDGGTFCVGNFNMNGKHVNIFQEDI